MEKYDLVQRESDVSTGIQYDYSEDVIDFGGGTALVLRFFGER